MVAEDHETHMRASRQLERNGCLQLSLDAPLAERDASITAHLLSMNVHPFGHLSRAFIKCTNKDAFG